jgi:thioredoxin reductase (NADPH)
LKTEDLIMEQNQEIHDVIIIGAGPAGFSAALYAARAELKPLVLTGTQLGGQAALTDRIENYPGFPEGVGGGELSELFQKNAERFGAQVLFDTVTAVDFSKAPFQISTYGRQFLARAVIVCSGASPRNLGIPGETELRGRGVSYCATCDGWFFKNKPVAVIGGGDSALEEGLFLTRFASSVTIIHRRAELRASPILQKRAEENEKVKFIWNSVAEQINGTDGVKNVVIRNVISGDKTTLDVEGVFIFIGHQPNTELFKQYLKMDEKGYLIADQRLRTNIPGIFAAGEVADENYRQVITSAGMGAAAAIEATRYLENLHA